MEGGNFSVFIAMENEPLTHIFILGDTTQQTNEDTILRVKMHKRKLEVLGFTEYRILLKHLWCQYYLIFQFLFIFCSINYKPQTTSSNNVTVLYD